MNGNCFQLLRDMFHCFVIKCLMSLVDFDGARELDKSSNILQIDNFSLSEYASLLFF